MDQEHIRLLAKLKLKAKKDLNISIDLQAMAVDAAYAELILKAVEERASDEETLMAVIKLREGLLPAKPAAAPAPEKPESDPDKPAKGRDYRFGARGG